MRKLVKSTEKRQVVLNRLGLKPAATVNMKYVMIDGIPHKMKGGVLTAMTKKS